MDQYPPDALRHLTPLVLISGLATPDGIDPSLHSRLWAHNGAAQHPYNGLGEQLANAPALREHYEEEVIMPELFHKFASKSANPTVWNQNALDIARRTSQHFINIQFLSSNDNPEYKLPPIKSRRKAAASTVQSKDHDDNASIASRQSIDTRLEYSDGALHSPLSPLSSTSDLYPDGVISEKWLQKYEYFLPSTLVSIHLLSNKTDDEQIEADELLSKKINRLKNQLSTRNIKLIVIIVSEKLPSVDPSLNDRIFYLRKSTGLAPRTGLFFMPPTTEVELETLVETVCQLSFSQALEFYANIAKQIRRKRGGRPKSLNILPEEAATMTTSPLSHAGWEIRYSFKLASLAEFRQELDAAMNAYETTYEMALELFETFHPLTETPAASWIAFRKFLDLVAFKIVKLNCYNGLPHLAYKKFHVHLKSVTAVLEGHRFSRNGYAYKNWRALQYRLLATFVQDAQGVLFRDSAPFAANANEQEPANCLPRSGLLNLTSANMWLEILNSEVEDDDYIDPYLNAEVSEVSTIVANVKQALNAAVFDFKRQPDLNSRNLGFAYYLLAEISISHEKDDKAALDYYKQALAVYRKDKWNPLLTVVLKKLIQTSLAAHDHETAFLSKLELSLLTQESATDSDLDEKLSQLTLSPKSIVLPSEQLDLGLYSADFTFFNTECFLGLPIAAQASITCNFPSSSVDSKLHVIEEFTISISNELASIHVVHNDSLPVLKDGFIKFTDLKIEDASVEYADRVLHAEANLSFRGGQKIIFEFSQVPKKLGEAQFSGITVVAKHENFSITSKLPVVPRTSGTVSWYSLAESVLSSRFVRNVSPFHTTLLQRPSLITVALDQSHPVALGERALLNAIVTSTESEEVILELQVKGITNKGDAISAKWLDEDAHEELGDHYQGIHIPSRGTKSLPLKLEIPSGAISSVTLEFFVNYYSANDEETLIKDDVVLPLNVLKPFNVNFDVNPRFHAEPWQSFFIPSFTDDTTDVSYGISPPVTKKWELCASVLCLTEGTEIEVLGSELSFESSPGSLCDIVTAPEAASKTMTHNENQKFNYIFHTSRTTHNEVRHVSAEAHLKILWQRPAKNGSAPIVNEFKITPVRLNLPLIEPRVIVGKFRVSLPSPPIIS